MEQGANGCYFRSTYYRTYYEFGFTEDNEDVECSYNSRVCRKPGDNKGVAPVQVKDSGHCEISIESSDSCKKAWKALAKTSINTQFEVTTHVMRLGFNIYSDTLYYRAKSDSQFTSTEKGLCVVYAMSCRHVWPQLSSTTR